MPNPKATPSMRTQAIVMLVALAFPLAMSGGVSAAPSEAELEAAEARLMEIEREFELIVESYNAANIKLEKIQHDMAATQLVVRQIERRMTVKQDAAVALAVELYKAGPAGSAVEAVLSSESLADIDTRMEYLESSNDAQSEVFERLAVDRADLDAHLADLEEQKAQALRTQTRLETLRQDVEFKLAEQEGEIAELNAALERARAREAARLEAQRQAAALAAASSGGVLALDDASIKPAPAPNKGAQAAVDAALSQLGKPYRWGAEGPDSYDCSGLTLWAWAHASVSLPHNSGMQFNATPRVPRDDLQPGDLLFYGSPIHHVSMYIGNGQMVEAPYTGSEVRVVSADRWKDYVGAGRPGV